MKTAKVARGALYLALQNVAQYAILFFSYVALSRILTQAEVGKISLLQFLMTLFAVLSRFAVPAASTKYISQNIAVGQLAKARAAAKTSLRLVLSLSVPSLVLLFIASAPLSTIVFGTDTDAVVLAIVFLSSFVFNLSLLFVAELQGLGRFGEMASAALVYVLVAKTLGVVLAWLGYGVTGVVVGWLVGAVSSFVASATLLRGKLSGEGERFPARTILSYSYPVLMYQTVNIAQTWADVVLLYALTSDLSAVGVYYVAVAGANALSVFWVALTGAAFPAMSARHGKKGPEGVSGALKLSARTLNLTVIPIGAALAAASQSAVAAAYGSAYLPGAFPFAVLTLSAIVPAYVALFTVAIQAMGQTKALIPIGATSILVDILVVSVLAQPLGAMGAVLARVCMLLAALALSYRSVRRQVTFSADFSSLKRALLLSILLAVPIALMDWAFIHLIHLNLLWRLIAEGALFVSVGIATARIFSVFQRSDFDLLREAFPRQLRRALDFAEKALLPRTQKRRLTQSIDDAE